jgi:hypothetical protein
MLLILNDFLLKELFNNWLTGKISDFAGLFVFTIFWTTIFPASKKYIYSLTALTFIYWKSTYSDGLIAAWNSFDLINISRVADITDLMALSMIPAAHVYEKYKDNFYKISMSPVIPIVVSSFAFAATSTSQEEVVINKSYYVNYSKDVLADKLIAIDSTFTDPDVIFTNNSTDTIYLGYKTDLCVDAAWVYVTVTELSKHRLELTLLSAATYGNPFACDSAERTEEFESVIINKIK